MSQSLALAVGSMLLSALVDTIYKRALMSGSRPTSFLLTQSLVFNALNWAVALAGGGLRLEPALLFFGPLAAATLLIGFYGWIQKLGALAGIAPAAFLVAQGFIYISIALPSSIMSRSIRPGRVELTLAPISGVLNSVAYLMLLYSLRTGEASVNIPIVQLSFVLTAVLGALVLHERLSRRKVLGLLAAVLAVVVFNVRG